MPSNRRRFSGSSWWSLMRITASTTRRNRLPSILPETAIVARRSPASSPASMRMARSTSWAAVRSGTRPISLRYIRTGSKAGVLSSSSRRRRRAPSVSIPSSLSSPGTSMTSMPSSLRTCSTWARNSSICSGVSCISGSPPSTSSDVTKPRSRPFAAMASVASLLASLKPSPSSGSGGIVATGLAEAEPVAVVMCPMSVPDNGPTGRPPCRGPPVSVGGQDNQEHRSVVADGSRDCGEVEDLVIAENPRARVRPLRRQDDGSSRIEQTPHDEGDQRRNTQASNDLWRNHKDHPPEHDVERGRYRLHPMEREYLDQDAGHRAASHQPQNDCGPWCPKDQETEGRVRPDDQDVDHGVIEPAHAGAGSIGPPDPMIGGTRSEERDQAEAVDSRGNPRHGRSSHHEKQDGCRDRGEERDLVDEPSKKRLPIGP